MTSNTATGQIAVGSGDLGTIATDLADSMNLKKGTPQEDTITLTTGGILPETGVIYTIDINGEDITYTTNGIDGTLDAIAAGIADAINANGTINTVLTATAAGGVVTLTSNTNGISGTFTTDVESVTVAGRYDDPSRGRHHHDPGRQLGRAAVRHECDRVQK